jgi:hypothetical protein
VLKGPIINLIQKLAGFVAELADKFQKLPAAQQQNIVSFMALAAVAGPLSIILGQLVGMLSAFFRILLGTSLMSVVTQLLLLAAAIYYTYKNWDLLKQAWENFKVSDITSKIQKMIDKFYELDPSRIQKLNDEWVKYAETVKGAGEIQAEIASKQKQYETLTQQLSQVKNAQELEGVYNDILRVLEQINTLKGQIVAKDIQDKGIKPMTYEAGALDLKLNLSSSVTRQMQKNAEKIKEGIKDAILPKPDEIDFGDVLSAMFSNIGSDIMSGVNKVQKLITGIDFTKMTGGFGIGDTKNDRANDLVTKLQPRSIKPQKLIPIWKPDVEIATMMDEMTSSAERYQKIIDLMIISTNEDLQKNAEVAQVLGKGYDRAASDVNILNTALDQLTAPEMVKIMTPDQLDAVKEYLTLLDKIQNKQRENNKELAAWKGLFSSIGTLMGDLSQYMSESFQKVWASIQNGIQIISDVIGRIKAVKNIIAATNAVQAASTTIQAVSTTTTAASIPVVLAAAAAEEVKAAASEHAAIAGAASSTSWIPVVGVALAVAGVAAILIALSSGKKKKATGMATGGVVPEGFPNDTFPAMLTSGEIVIPLNKRNQVYQEINNQGVPKGITNKILPTISTNVNVASSSSTKYNKVAETFSNNTYSTKLNKFTENVSNSSEFSNFNNIIDTTRLNSIREKISTNTYSTKINKVKEEINPTKLNKIVAELTMLVTGTSDKRAKVTGLIQGGMIPSGFPNDSFPAMLSSGETVIPLNKVGDIFGNGAKREPREVVFKIGHRELIAVLQDSGILNTSF